jgi:hypothetical protein
MEGGGLDLKGGGEKTDPWRISFHSRLLLTNKREGPAKRNGRLSKDYGTVKSREGGR